MAFLFRLMLYLMLSIPFGLLSWLFNDLTQRIAYSAPFWRIPDPMNLLPALTAIVAFLPWILAAAVIAAIEANKSRSVALTALATTMFWGAAMVFSTGTALLPDSLHRFARFGPDLMPHMFTRHLHEWFNPHVVFGQFAGSIPGYWQIQALIVPMFMLGLVMALILSGAFIFAMLQRRTVS